MNITKDNRNLSDVSDYQEARIEALKRRVRELEAENAELTRILFDMAVILPEVSQ